MGPRETPCLHLPPVRLQGLKRVRAAGLGSSSPARWPWLAADPARPRARRMSAPPTTPPRRPRASSSSASRRSDSPTYLAGAPGRHAPAVRAGEGGPHHRGRQRPQACAAVPGHHPPRPVELDRAGPAGAGVRARLRSTAGASTSPTRSPTTTSRIAAVPRDRRQPQPRRRRQRQDRADRPAPLRQPQRRTARVRPRRRPVHRDRRRRQRGRPDEPGQNTSVAGRQDPADQPARRRRLLDPGGQPVRRRRRQASRRSGRTACAIPGGSRSIAAPATWRSATSARTSTRRSTSLRAGTAGAPTTAGASSRADPRYKRGSAPGAVFPVLVAPHSAGYCAIIGGYVVRDRSLPSLYGRYLLRRRLQAADQLREAEPRPRARQPCHRPVGQRDVVVRRGRRRARLRRVAGRTGLPDRSQSRSMAVRALVFDVFGTLVDWRTGIAEAFDASGLDGDPAELADDWRKRYVPILAEVNDQQAAVGQLRRAPLRHARRPAARARARCLRRDPAPARGGVACARPLARCQGRPAPAAQRPCRGDALNGHVADAGRPRAPRRPAV